LARRRPSLAPAAAVVAAASAAAVAVAVAVASGGRRALSSSSSSCSSSPSSPADPPAAPDPSEGPSRYGRAVSAGLRACARESHAYGRCAAGFLPDAAPRGACEREFSALRRCFLAASGLGGWRQRQQQQQQPGAAAAAGGEEPDRTPEATGRSERST